MPHVHVHVIPRCGPTAKDSATTGDELYERMTDEDGNVGGALVRILESKFPLSAHPTPKTLPFWGLVVESLLRHSPFKTFVLPR